MTDEDALGPCGCTDYHMADCPLRTGGGEDDHLESDYEDRNQGYHPDDPSLEDEMYDHADPSNY